MRKKFKEPVEGVYASQDWSQKKALAKRIPNLISPLQLPHSALHCSMVNRVSSL